MKVRLKKRITEQAAEKVAISSEYIKLDAFLKFCCAADTGGIAKLMIQEGDVKVNGEICQLRGKKLRPGDRVETGGKLYELTAEEK
ncbi:MAG: RNA-binding S4 domain-containing protein [Oscillospiraceae bacterium]|nr:RNA-binding S4 domain-containing protein [Oscillospiraceae bacterium]